jgi:serine/threonine-protein kinase
MMNKLGKYLIRRELGKGAMGIVYEGFDPFIQRTVAIKTLIPSQLTSSDAIATLARFKREAQAAGRLNHPGIVGIYEYGEAIAEDDFTMVTASSVGPSHSQGQQLAFIAMEYVIGLDLKDYFDRNERFALRDVERLMCEILDALDHAHGKGVTHRDMKPSNLILLSDGKVKIADFGIARIETSELTQSGTIMGTPSYMSPEQFRGQSVDGRSDLFSCGVILYQLLTGEKPFTGATSTIMFKVLSEDPIPPSALNIVLPAAWDQVTRKAMTKNPDERFQTAREFSMAVHAAAAEPIVDWKLTTAGQTAASPMQQAPGPGAQETNKVFVWALRVGALALMLVIGALGASLLSGESRNGARSPVPQAPSPRSLETPAVTSPIVAPQAATIPVAPASVPKAIEAVVPTVISPPLAVSRPQMPKIRSAGNSVSSPTQAAAGKPDVQATAGRPARCALIIQKAAMDEPISPTERNFLRTSCQ